MINHSTVFLLLLQWKGKRAQSAAVWHASVKYELFVPTLGCVPKNYVISS